MHYHLGSNQKSTVQVITIYNNLFSIYLEFINIGIWHNIMLSLAAYAGLLILPFMAIPFYKTGDGVYLYGFNQVIQIRKIRFLFFTGRGRRFTPGMII